MASITLVYGSVLVLLGVIGYLASGMASVTALIPAFVGVPVVICGLLARRESLRKHAMHVAVVLGMIGMLGAARGLPGLLDLLAGGEVERPPAVIAQSVMFLLSLVFVAACVRSFVLARRQMAGGD